MPARRSFLRTLSSTPLSSKSSRIGSVLMKSPIARSAPEPPCIRPNSTVPKTTFSRPLAAVAAVALTSSGHEEKTYGLTGAESLSPPEQVEILSKVIGKPIECVDIPVEVAAERAIASGLPEVLVKSLAELWVQVRKESYTFRTNEVERLTGQPAQTFETWCREHRSAFV